MARADRLRTAVAANVLKWGMEDRLDAVNTIVDEAASMCGHLDRGEVDFTYSSNSGVTCVRFFDNSQALFDGYAPIF